MIEQCLRIEGWFEQAFELNARLTQKEKNQIESECKQITNAQYTIYICEPS